MKDAFGGILNLVLIAVFLVIVSGVLGLTVSYTKAFNFKKQPDICMDGGPDFSCDLKDLYASARGYGDVRVNSKDNGCRISSDGYSYCE